MGTVYLARDTALAREVAIKVLRPELATASAVERFLREARILASLSHPNVVPVHRAGEADGLPYYVMDYLAVDTLAGRIAAGPLPPADAVAVALDLLAALEAAHRHGVVHRDVKPSNVHLCEGRAVLADFGIASSRASAGEPLTLPGRPLGTPDYMAPEQMVGKPATPATDLCGVGLVLFESLTGRRFEAWDQPDRADWSRVPRHLVPVLKRALALDPAARWADAAAFRAALVRATSGRRLRRILAGAAALSVAAAAVAFFLAGPRHAGSGARTLHVVVPPFRVTGGAPAWLADSLAGALVHALGANPDFLVRLASAPGDTAGALVLDARATVRADSLAVEVTGTGAAGAGAFHAAAGGTLAGWDGAATRLAYEVLLEIWSERNASLAADLPRGAAPHTPEGLRAFLRAELLFAHAQWAAAYRAYTEAGTLDPTCLVCAVRLEDVARWLGLEPDTAVTRRYHAARDSFPPHYRQLIAAGFQPPDERLATLRDLTQGDRGWGFGWFILGDEIFHRGPLAGLRRAESLRPFEEATVLRPDFAPAWEHLAWAATAEGDSATARTALDRYLAIASSGDAAALTIGALLQAGFVWRFAPQAYAEAFTDQLLHAPGIGAAPELRAGASFMLTFEAPRGAVFVGERFAHGVPRAELEVPGLLAQVYGLTALGRPDSALAVARRAAARTGEPAIALFVAELPAALALADSQDVAARWDALAAPLQPFADGTTRASTLERARAAWMLSLLAHRAGRDGAVAGYRHALAADTRAGAPLAEFAATAVGQANGAMPAPALRRSTALTALDSANRGGDPFFRALLHLYRAGWQAAAAAPALAAAELRWHENNDFVGYPGLAPQAGEVDYALATIARWDRGRILAGLGPEFRDEACAAFATVARAWAGAEPRYFARADSARARLAALHCEASR